MAAKEIPELGYLPGEYDHYGHAHRIPVQTISGAKIECKLDIHYVVADRQEVRKWRKFGRSRADHRLNEYTSEFTRNLSEDWIEPIFWAVFNEKKYFFAIDAIHHKPRIRLYRLLDTGQGTRIEIDGTGVELRKEIERRAGTFRGCGLSMVTAHDWKIIPESVEEVVSMMSRSLREQVEREAPHMPVQEMGVLLALDKAGKWLGVLKGTKQEVSGLTIEWNRMSHGVSIIWNTAPTENYNWKLRGYRKPGGFDGIVAPQNMIVDSVERSGRTFSKIEPDTEAYYLFRLEGWRPRGFFEKAVDGGEWMPVAGQDLTFSVYRPEEASPLEKAQEEARIAEALAVKRRHEKEGKGKAEQEQEVIRQGVLMADIQAREFMNIEQRRQQMEREIKAKKLDPEEEKAQVEIINSIYVTLAERIRSMF